MYSIQLCNAVFASQTGLNLQQPIPIFPCKEKGIV